MTFGYIVLYGWPVVVAILFKIYDRRVALLAAMIAGYLLLPTRLFFDLPALPPLNKETMPSLAALAAVLMTRPSGTIPERPGWVPQATMPKVLLGILVVGAFLTVFTNGDPLIYGDTFLPPLRPYDALSSIMEALVMLIPFLLARKLLAAPDAQKMFLAALIISALVYSLLALYEVRMSPQLNNMVYGFFPHAWDQHVRGGGFRPLVFLRHGLWLAIFFSAAILAAAGLARVYNKGKAWSYRVAVMWLLFTLVLSKALGALAITLLLLPIVMMYPMRIQVMVAAIVSGAVLVYPMLRSAGLVPVNTVLNWALSISAERAQSFGFRLQNEDVLLSKALERPLLGWGGWGRNHGYNLEGLATTVVDGYWVGVLGVGGWAKYIGEFGLLCLPCIFLFFLIRRYKVGMETSVLAVILAGNVVDLIPNATITPLTWMMAGAIWGRMEMGAQAATIEADEGPRTKRVKAVLTRFGPHSGNGDPGYTRPPPKRASAEPSAPLSRTHRRQDSG